MSDVFFFKGLFFFLNKSCGLQNAERVVLISFPDGSRRRQLSETAWQVTTLPIDVRFRQAAPVCGCLRNKT